MVGNVRQLESLFSTFSLELASASVEQLEDTIQTFIAQVGSELEADRCYLLLIDEATQTLSTSHEYCAPDISPQSDAIQDVPMARFSWLAEQLASESVVAIPDVEKLTPAAAEEQREFRRQGIGSPVLVGLRLDGDIAGALGFDYVGRSVSLENSEKQALEKLAAILGASVHRPGSFQEYQ